LGSSATEKKIYALIYHAGVHKTMFIEIRSYLYAVFLSVSHVCLLSLETKATLIGKIEVNVTQQRSMMAQKGSRGIILLFLQPPR
jgi:hypothetical protein